MTAKIESKTRIYRDMKKFLNEVIYIIKDKLASWQGSRNRNLYEKRKNQHGNRRVAITKSM